MSSRPKIDSFYGKDSFFSPMYVVSLVCLNIFRHQVKFCFKNLASLSPPSASCRDFLFCQR